MCYFVFLSFLVRQTAKRKAKCHSVLAKHNNLTKYEFWMNILALFLQHKTLKKHNLKIRLKCIEMLNVKMIHSMFMYFSSLRINPWTGQSPSSQKLTARRNGNGGHDRSFGFGRLTVASLPVSVTALPSALLCPSHAVSVNLERCSATSFKIAVVESEKKGMKMF